MAPDAQGARGWPMSRRLRLILLICGGIVLAALLTLVVVVYLLLQPERFTSMLQSQAQNIGLELHLAEPASPSLFPSPALELRGITLNAQRATTPILLAARGRLALPWRTLFGGPTVISQLQIEAPRVDLDALQAWLDELPPSKPGKVLDIPRIDTGVSIRRGSIVRGNSLLLSNLDLEAGHLVSGQPFPLQLSARTPSGLPLTLRLSSTPRIDGGTLELQDIALHLEQGARLAMSLGGSARWNGAAHSAANLAGTLDEADAGQYRISLQLTPASATQPSLLLAKLGGPGNHANVELPPQEFAAWWGRVTNNDDPQLALPPGRADVRIDKLQTGRVSVRGLSITTVADEPAASASAGPASAASAPKSPQAATPARR